MMKRLFIALLAILLAGCHGPKNSLLVRNEVEALPSERITYEMTNATGKPLLIKAGVWWMGRDEELSEKVLLKSGESRKWQPFLHARTKLADQDRRSLEFLQLRSPFAEYTFHLYEVKEGFPGEYLGKLRESWGVIDFPPELVKKIKIFPPTESN